MKKPQLFLLHFAGGNCYSFQFIRPFLTSFETISLELPGRGKRATEPLLKNFDLAALDIFNQLLQKLISPSFVIYGHSLGAYLALRVTNLLEQAGKKPACLIVSGNAGPGLKDRPLRYLLNRDAFIDELEKLGGIPQELLGNEELFNFFEPILRADFELSERNNMDEETAVKTPLYAMMGNREEEAEEIANWARFTRSGFGYEIMEGDHFFIHRHPERIAAVIKNYYETTAIPQHQ